MWFHRHKWYPVSTINYTDTSYNNKVASCMVVSRCLTCGELSEKSFYGSGPLDLSDLQNAPTTFTVPGSKNSVNGYQPTTAESKPVKAPPKKP